ncbi:MAG: MBL fold metallo-hydrolase [Deltaproteobacteria bacterium]|nr:MBL fold metallo-hydrolase [Deltaproteobacteria bacterium]MCB2186331.1 MBL fold metallo-hydrolase [Deltaproteobacteria bacterium]
MQIIQLLVGNMAVFAYIVACEKTGQGLVIDPAGNEDRILAEAAKRGITLVKIVNTHGHPDHTCGNFRIKEATGAQILIHEEDAPHMNSPHALQFAQMLGCSQIPPADVTVKDGEIIEAGEEVRLQVIHTPGHSPGCICLHTPGHVFTGDTLFVGGVGRTDLPGGSWAQMVSAIKNRILALPDDTVIWPGHNYGPSPKSTVAQERRGNPYLN